VEPIRVEPGEVPADLLAYIGREVTPESPQLENRKNDASANPLETQTSDGDPGAIRTRDPQLRRLFVKFRNLLILLRYFHFLVRSRSAMRCQEMP